MRSDDSEQLSIDLNIRLQPKQKQLYRLITDHTENCFDWIGFAGARGGAKSRGIRDIALLCAMQYPRIRILIFRRTSKNLYDTHIARYQAEHPKIWSNFYKSTHSELYLPVGQQGGEKIYSLIKFGSADREAEISNYQSHEYDIIFIDEATHLTQKMLEELRGANRSTILQNFVPKMVLTMNPGGVGHKFIKRIFIKKEYTPEEKLHNRYFYLPAKVQDNVIWSEQALKNKKISIHTYYNEWTDKQRFDFTIKHSPYAQILASLPKYRRMAYLYGDWDSFEGQFFEKLSKSIHYIEPFQVPASYKIQGSFDYGNTTASHIIRWNKKGQIFVTNEFSAYKGDSRDYKIVKYYEWICRIGLKDAEFRVVCDNPMFDLSNELPEKKATAELLKEYFDEMNPNNQITFMPVTKKKSADGRSFRHWCNDEIQSKLDYELDKNANFIKKPNLYIFSYCKKLYESMSELMVDENDPEDMDKEVGEHHWYDSLKYNVMNIGTVAENKKSKKISEVAMQEIYDYRNSQL